VLRILFGEVSEGFKRTEAFQVVLEFNSTTFTNTYYMPSPSWTPWGMQHWEVTNHETQKAA
jgi:hypothetical protein